MGKYFYEIVSLICLSCLLFACENKNEVDEAWNAEPIEEYTVEAINGGAEISYTIPEDPDILYIMAEYERNGKIFTEKSSIYKNVIRIEGFDTTDKVLATLYKVNKKEQKSQPIVVEFEPLESLISIAKKSLQVIPGFGGLIASWYNPTSTEFGVRLMKQNEDGVLDTDRMVFSESVSERYSFRDLEAKETTFGISFEDKWGNVSDTIVFIMTPLFETVVDKPYADYRSNIPYDNTSNLSGRTMASLWDNIVNTSGHGWLSSSGSSGLSITIDLKQVVKLSRVVIHGYHINSPYTQVNIQRFELWGIDEIDYNKLSDRPYWLDEFSVRAGAIHGVDNTTVLPGHTFKDDWEYLGDHSIIRYDLMSPVDNAGVQYISQNGSEYEIPIDAEPVRYVRLFVRQVNNLMPPPSSNYFSMGEITFYGDNTIAQQ